MNYRSPASSWGIWWRACFIDAWTRRTCSGFWARGPWKTARRAPYWRVSSSFCRVFLLVLPGVIARVLYPDLDPYDRAYARLVHGLLPPRLRGLVVAGVVTAGSVTPLPELFSSSFFIAHSWCGFSRPSSWWESAWSPVPPRRKRFTDMCSPGRPNPEKEQATFVCGPAC